METVYYPEDDILEIHFSDNPVVKEVSQNWNIHVSYDAAGNIAEMVILAPRRRGSCLCIYGRSTPLEPVGVYSAIGLRVTYPTT